MPVSLKINHKPVPGTHGNVRLWYAQTQSHGCTSVDECVKRIEQMCTVTEADVRGVIAAFKEVCLDTMATGCGVSLGPLGTIYPRVKSVLADTPADCSTQMVESLHPRWIAPKRLAKRLKTDLAPSYRIAAFGAEHVPAATPGA